MTAVWAKERIPRMVPDETPIDASLGRRRGNRQDKDFNLFFFQDLCHLVDGMTGNSHDGTTRLLRVVVEKGEDLELAALESLVS